MTQILLYINHNYASISLEEVAEEFHYSKTYLNRIFKKHMGTTILKQIQDTRLQESCLLLKNTRMSVEDIALHVGYEDTSYFIELFKKKYKKTPLQYRNDIDQFYITILYGMKDLFFCFILQSTIKKRLLKTMWAVFS